MSFSSIFKWSTIETPIGKMRAVANATQLYSLEFIQEPSYEVESISEGENDPILSIKDELKRYFEGSLRDFQTEFYLKGSDFQKAVLKELLKIPHGNKASYKEIASLLGNANLCRAVARINSLNRLLIIIPCHRIISSDGSLGGYSAGIDRKKWLLSHEIDPAYSIY